MAYWYKKNLKKIVKNLNKYISEKRYLLDRDFEIDNLEDIDKSYCKFTDDEIDIIVNFIQYFKIYPYAISNKIGGKNSQIKPRLNELYIYFSDEYKTKGVIKVKHQSYYNNFSYISIEKTYNGYQIKLHEKEKEFNVTYSIAAQNKDLHKCLIELNEYLKNKTNFFDTI